MVGRLVGGSSLCGVQHAERLTQTLDHEHLSLTVCSPLDRFIKWYTRQHVFCTEEMCQDLEKMIPPEIKKPRFFIDDPYEPYNKRHGIEFVPHGKLQVSKSYVKMTEDY